MLTLNKVSVTDGRSLSDVETSIPEDFDGLEKFLGGRDKILGYALASLTIAAQAYGRGKLAAQKDGKDEFSDADVRKAVKEWKPGESRKEISEYDRMVRAAKDLRKLGMVEQAAEIEAKLAKMTKPAKTEEAPKPKAAPGLRKSGKKAA